MSCSTRRRPLAARAPALKAHALEYGILRSGGAWGTQRTPAGSASRRRGSGACSTTRTSHATPRWALRDGNRGEEQRDPSLPTMSDDEGDGRRPPRALPEGPGSKDDRPLAERAPEKAAPRRREDLRERQLRGPWRFEGNASPFRPRNGMLAAVSEVRPPSPRAPRPPGAARRGEACRRRACRAGASSRESTLQIGSRPGSSSRFGNPSFSDAGRVREKGSVERGRPRSPIRLGRVVMPRQMDTPERRRHDAPARSRVRPSSSVPPSPSRGPASSRPCPAGRRGSDSARGDGRSSAPKKRSPIRSQ